jgi:hypothetical protein
MGRSRHSSSSQYPAETSAGYTFIPTMRGITYRGSRYDPLESARSPRKQCVSTAATLPGILQLFPRQTTLDSFAFIFRLGRRTVPGIRSVCRRLLQTRNKSNLSGYRVMVGWVQSLAVVVDNLRVEDPVPFAHENVIDAYALSSASKSMTRCHFELCRVPASECVHQHSLWRP